MEVVSIVTIKNKIPLFKGEEQANAIELIELEEVGFELVAGKDTYNIGDKAIYIQPDYCLSDISLFESFIRPGGDPKKSMLGSNNRIRAKKFNLHRGDGEPVYSNGILLPIDEIIQELNFENLKEMLSFYENDNEKSLAKSLNITKWEEPDPRSGGLKVGGSKAFPEGVYKTDETNIHNVWSRLSFPITLVGTEKIDGSSITIGVKNGKGFICSRNLEKPLTYMKTIGRRRPTMFETFRSWFGYKPDLNIKQEVSNDQDDFVKYGKPYLDVLVDCDDNIILRGELNGGSMKGSGNKNNPARLEPVNIKFFTIDDINESGIAVKKSYINTKTSLEYLNACPEYQGDLQFDFVKEVFNKEFSSREELLKECNDYFKDNMLEGIVVRTLDSSFSAKVMNLEYDSKK